MAHIDDASRVNPDGPQSKTDLVWITDAGLDPPFNDAATEDASVSVCLAQQDN